MVLFDKVVDTQYAAMLEQEGEWKFLRIDAELADALKDKEIEEREDADLQALFCSASGEESLKLKVTAFKDSEVPAVLNLGEDDRRMRDMMQMYGMDTKSIPTSATILLNAKNSLIQKLLACENEETKKSAAGHIYLLALLSQRPLTADELKRFLSDSYRNLENSL